MEGGRDRRRRERWKEGMKERVKEKGWKEEVWI
jgi:hypothetical protein